MGRHQDRKTCETAWRSSASSTSPWAGSAGWLLEPLSLLDLAQGAGTEPLIILHSPRAAWLGWHGHLPLRPSIVFSCWIAAPARNAIRALNEWEKGQLTSGSS